MLHNQGTDAMAGLNPHTQRSDLPGASAAGAACAKAADLYPRVSDLGVAIDAWMAVDVSPPPDARSPARADRRRLCSPSRWNADGRLEVRKRYAQGHYLARRVSCGQADRRSARLWRRTMAPEAMRSRCNFHRSIRSPGVTAKLTDANGNPVQFFLSDPEHPATSFGQFGVICLIPKLSLQAQQVYTVRIDATWKGRSRCARLKPRMIARSPAR
jgi:hypothetical protein